MAYTPKTWVCGETITADGLNNIEEGVQEALECCESGGDCGYECTETSTLLTEESVTTSGSAPYITGNLSYSELINATSLIVTFNGTEYVADKVEFSGSYMYGGFSPSGPDFSEYPFAIISNGTTNILFTDNAGTYSIKIIGVFRTITVSDCFEKAVKLFGLKYVADAEIEGGVLANNVGANTVTALYALAEGSGTTASGMASHAEGSNTTASGEASHAEGGSSTATGDCSHAEGDTTTASGRGSHAEGGGSTASGLSSHAEGGSTASGTASHAEGGNTTASGMYSHAQNTNTIAQGEAQTAIGKFNIAQGNASSSSATDYAFIIGNGAADIARSNALAIKWDGTFVFANGTEITPTQFASLLALL